MATIAPAPFTLANALLVIGANNYEKAVSGVRIEPKNAVLTWKGLTPDAVYTDTSAPEWTCKFSYAQDWETANSLSQWLLANAGTQQSIVLKPRGAAAGKPIFTLTVVVVPGPIGGDGNTILDGEVEMAVVGQPVKTTAP